MPFQCLSSDLSSLLGCKPTDVVPQKRLRRTLYVQSPCIFSRFCALHARQTEEAVAFNQNSTFELFCK